MNRFWRELGVHLAFVVLGFVAVSTSFSAWNYTRVTNSPIASISPRITYDGIGDLHIFWVEGEQIQHRVHDGDTWVLMETVGEGHSMDLMTCLACNDIYLTWVGLDDLVRFRSWKFGIWQDEEVLPSGGVGPTMAAAVTKVELGHVLWAEYDGSAQQFAMFYSKQLGSTWSAPVQLGVTTQWSSHPSIGLRTMDSTGRLVASWLDEGSEVGVIVRSGEGATWTPPERVAEALAGPYDIDSDPPAATAHLVGNGPQPSCPCNVVFYVEGEPGAWSEPVQIGTGHYPAEMEWPQQISTHVRAGTGVPHTVWRHESYEMLELVDERLVYGFKDGDDWSFETDFAVGRNAQEPRVGTNEHGDPTLVWCDDSDGSFDVYMATRYPVSSIVGAATPTSKLIVYPNPTEGNVTIRGVFGAGGRGMGDTGSSLVTLEILDPQGRRVKSLETGTASRDNFEVLWDATNARGDDVPSGMYVARFLDLESRETVARQQIVVIR